MGSGGPDDNDAQAGRLVAVPISGDALRAGDAKTPSADAEGRVRLRDPGLGIGVEGDPAFTLTGASPGAVGQSLVPALTTRAGNTQDDQQLGQLVAHSLTSAGHDASDGGSGRGTPIIAAPLTKGSATGEGVNQPGRRQEDDVNIVAFHTTQDPIHHHHHHHHALGQEGAGVLQGHAVRRLTPTECERLQGFPDGWTDLGDTPDSRRYSALGDAVTTTVARWIGERLLANERRPLEAEDTSPIERAEESVG